MSYTRAHGSLLYLGRRTGQVSCIVLFTSLHLFSMGFISGARGGQSVRLRHAAIAILEPHENYEWRSGLAVNGLYNQDRASIQRAPLRSAKCANIAGRPGDPLYDGESSHFMGIRPQQRTDTQPLCSQADIYCVL